MKSLSLNRISFSRYFLAIIVVAHLIDWLSGGILSNAFALKPIILLEKMELWRLISYPFANDSIQGFILFAITFYLFSPRLEDLLKKRFYPLILLLVIALQGTLLTLFFWKSNIQFNGLQGLSLFVITLFTLLNANKQIIIKQFKPIRTYVLSTVILFAWFTSIFGHAIIIGNMTMIFTATSAGLIGVGSGLLTYLQIRTARMIFSRDLPGTGIETAVEPRDEEYATALVTRKKAKNSHLDDDAELFGNNFDFDFNEDNLNRILDKINTSGRASLSDFEEMFLQEYSKNI